MNAMQQRIAQAIAKAVGERDPLDPKFLASSFYGDAARAVLKEMQDPTEDMCWYAKHRNPGVEREQARGIWFSMIDEALFGQ